MKYYQRIRALREDSDQKQATIANILETTQSYYSEYELGKRLLPINHLKTLCIHYNISADWILGLPEGLPHKENKEKFKEKIYKETVEEILWWAKEQGHIKGNIEIVLENIWDHEEEEYKM